MTTTVGSTRVFHFNVMQSIYEPNDTFTLPSWGLGIILKIYNLENENWNLIETNYGSAGSYQGSTRNSGVYWYWITTWAHPPPDGFQHPE